LQGQAMLDEKIGDRVERLKMVTDLVKLESEFCALGRDLAERGEAARAEFRDVQGFELLTRHQSVCQVLDKHPDSASQVELRLLRAVFQLCCGAGAVADEEKQVSAEGKTGQQQQTGSRDNRIRSLQIRGVAEYALQVATDEKFDESLRLAALRLLELITADGSVCKLLCNRMNFANDEGLYRNEFRNDDLATVCSLACLCRPPTERPAVLEACSRVLANLCTCPRLQRRLCDIQRPPPKLEKGPGEQDLEDSEAIKRLQEAQARANANDANPVVAVDKLVDTVADHLKSLGDNIADVSPTFADAIVRLSGLSSFRASARGHPKLLDCLARLATNVMDAKKSASAARVLAVSLIEPKEQLELFEELPAGKLQSDSATIPKQVADSMKVIELAKRLRSADVNKLLDDFLNCDVHPCEELFTLIYRSAYSDDLREDGSLDFKKLCNSLRKPDWADASPLLFAGALMSLARASRADPSSAVAFSTSGGFDLLTKHRALPTAMQVLSLEEHQDLQPPEQRQRHRQRIALLAAAYRLGCALAVTSEDSGRAHCVRFLQMPSVLDQSVKFLDPVMPHPMRDASLDILLAISQRPEVCKLMCNKLNLLPHLYLLPAQGEKGSNLLRQLLNCPRWKNRMMQDGSSEAGLLFDLDQQQPPSLELLISMRAVLGNGYPLAAQLDALINKLEPSG
ncbi:hypothetical protein BOX15_Mlig026203g1, partial [Macrostomum lignano]|uniref:ANK_REP_REGION domain-containing protein n=2 Tax=Macrostomum lignano TaxID=282301 RepID=A0A1I8J7N2_9PLAT